jgi:hypothetical protein
MAKIYSCLAISLTAAGLISGCHFLTSSRILFQSLESRTNSNQPVFNQIELIKQGDKDIWMMNQSHFGLNAPKDKWDRIAIIVDNSKTPSTAKYLQLPPGPLEWDDRLETKGIPFRASCFQCHSSGPRAIRPDDKAFNLNPFQKLKIWYWNLKIKSYSAIVENSDHVQTDPLLKVPFRHRETDANELLQVKTCNRCHNSTDPLARMPLTRQNAGTIEFLVKHGEMPPRGVFLSKKEKAQVQKFVLGF